MAARCTLDLLPGRYAVCRLPADAPWPDPPAAGLWSLTRTDAELSIVCEESAAPMGARVEPGWCALRVRGTLDFNATGILAGLTVPLARVGVSVFTISTFDTDWLLVREPQVATAVASLRDAGYAVG